MQHDPTNLSKLKKSLKPGDSPGDIFRLPDGKLLTFSKNEKGKESPKDFDELNCWTKQNNKIDTKSDDWIEKITTYTIKNRLRLQEKMLKKNIKLEKIEALHNKTHEKIKKIKKMENRKKKHDVITPNALILILNVSLKSNLSHDLLFSSLSLSFYLSF